MSEPSLEALLERRGIGDWAGLRDLERQAEKSLKDGGEERRLLAIAFDDVFSSDNGVRVLETLLDATLRKPATPALFAAGQPMSSEAIALHAAFRDGQNSIVAEIVRLIDEARNGAPRKPRRRVR